MQTFSERVHRTAGWRAWGILGLLAAYLIAMYGWVMRVNLGMIVAMFPWLLSQPGYTLYENVIMQYPPVGLWFGIVLYRLIPDPELRARLSMIVIMILSMLLIFRLARRWWGQRAGLVGAVLYTLWAPVFMHYLMNHDVLVSFVVLCAATVWHRADGPRRQPILSGLIVGLGVLVKPHVLAVLVVFVIWRMLGGKWRAGLVDSALFTASAALPVLIVSLILAAQGRLSGAVFWTWTASWSSYVGHSARLPGLRDWLLMAGWLAWVPLFIAYVLPHRDQWSSQDLLLLGLVPALATLAFPRFGRAHLAGAVPIVALIGAGALTYALEDLRQRTGIVRVGLRVYVLGVASVLLIALALPTYYRLKLGPLTGEYAELVPIVDRFAEVTGAEEGTRVWVVNEMDPTDNFYVIGNYQPPLMWAQIYSWYQNVPGLTESVVDGLDADPPSYAVVFERWRNQIPDELVSYLEAHYNVLEEMEAINKDGAVTVYQLAR